METKKRFARFVFAAVICLFLIFASIALFSFFNAYRDESFTVMSVTFGLCSFFLLAFLFYVYVFSRKILKAKRKRLEDLQNKFFETLKQKFKLCKILTFQIKKSKIVVNNIKNLEKTTKKAQNLKNKDEIISNYIVLKRELSEILLNYETDDEIKTNKQIVAILEKIIKNNKNIVDTYSKYFAKAEKYNLLISSFPYNLSSGFFGFGKIKVFTIETNAY